MQQYSFSKLYLSSLQDNKSGKIFATFAILKTINVFSFRGGGGFAP